MKTSKAKQGFTLVEIMIVVAIIGLLAAIAIPSFVKSRNQTRMNSCINNLRQIDSAKEQWGLNTGAADGAAVVVDEVNTYIKKIPECPASGTYTYGVLGVDPTCSATTVAYPHELPAGGS